MDTVTIQIGNTDGKLTGSEWTDFVQQIDRLLSLLVERVHFAGASNPSEDGPKACWVATITADEAATLERSLEPIRIRFRQESIAVTYGTTKFVGTE
jgi:hypothetical protein